MPSADGRRDVRRAAEQRGRRAEALAAWFLRLKGYRLLARRYRTPVGEIDLIVRRGRTIAFVEVKHRPTVAEATEAATPAGRRRVARAAALWLAKNPAAADRGSPLRRRHRRAGAFPAASRRRIRRRRRRVIIGRREDWGRECR